MFFAILLAAGLSSVADTPVRTTRDLPSLPAPRSELPDGVPDTSRWETHRVTLERTLVNDVLRIGGLTIQFIQVQGICPEGSTADCGYRVDYEFRRLMVDGSMGGFTQRFVVTGANGARTEGFCWFDMDRFRTEPRRGALMYSRSSGRWYRMDLDGPPLEQLKDFFMMLAELHEKQ